MANKLNDVFRHVIKLLQTMNVAQPRPFPITLGEIKDYAAANPIKGLKPTSIPNYLNELYHLNTRMNKTFVIKTFAEKEEDNTWDIGLDLIVARDLSIEAIIKEASAMRKDDKKKGKLRLIHKVKPKKYTTQLELPLPAGDPEFFVENFRHLAKPALSYATLAGPDEFHVKPIPQHQCEMYPPDHPDIIVNCLGKFVYRMRLSLFDTIDYPKFCAGGRCKQLQHVMSLHSGSLRDVRELQDRVRALSCEKKKEPMQINLNITIGEDNELQSVSTSSA